MSYLEKEIEKLRKMMYQAYQNNQKDLALKISVELDTLLNHFQKQGKIKK